METYGTGRSFQRVQATLNQNTPKIPQKIKLSISTEKLAEIVLLRIDDMDPNDAAQIAAGDSSADTLAERC